jgi:hypothetical protein
LYLCGKTEYENDIFKTADVIMSRQIPKNKAEDGLYGHFYTFSDGAYSEKSNVHHSTGHDCGAIYPHNIIPLIFATKQFSHRPEAKQWRECIRNFALGYMLPACEANPFKLLPVGYFTGEGLLSFCGPWHGINATYGYAAALAVHLEGYDRRFRDIAVSNLQWIAGLNSGITKESYKSSVLWEDDIPDDIAIPMSQIDGIGTRSVRAWSGIKGAIANGFSANMQFTFDTPCTMENDVPRYFCDEDWVPHTGGWACAMAHLYVNRRFQRKIYTND